MIGVGAQTRDLVGVIASKASTGIAVVVLTGLHYLNIPKVALLLSMRARTAASVPVKALIAITTTTTTTFHHCLVKAATLGMLR